MLLAIFHERKYSIEEFDKICQEARTKLENMKKEKYTIYELYHLLINDYGFESLNDKVICFNVNDNTSQLLKDDTELKYILS